ncbi:MAG: hypothetical protein KatS3mg111_0332 [Pirellulaceae bacterium]|nr:MAG: hypothetical protein KatS3mg111_0332 [Pirellulaceae bacterium]
MREKLEQTLQQLHELLHEAEDLTEEDRAMLRQAAEEIQATLDDEHVDSASLAHRLVESTKKFRDSHPMLTNTVGRLADLLSQMGI